MATKIFVNLAVKDLQASKDFYSNLGYHFNQQFTDEKAACLVISEDIYVMLLTEKFFKTFLLDRQIADARKQTETLIALSADSRQDVDALADKALTSGGKKFREAEDHGFMYTRSFEDPDGHVWEIVWMDPANLQQ